MTGVQTCALPILEKLQIRNSEVQTIDSREVAEMLEMKYYEFLKKLEGNTKQVGIIPTLTKGNFPVSDYFIETTYKDNSGKTNKSYLFTKMGCEFIANKFTGEKGILFTAKYVKRFNEMQQVIPQMVNDLEKTKLEIQKTRAEAMALNAKNRAFNTLMKSIEKHQNLSPIAVQVFGLKGLEGIFGVDVGNYLPEVEKTYSAKEVGEMLGISANKVGRIANANGLKTPEYGRYVADKSKNSDKEVENFRYNENGVKVLQELAW